MFEFIVAVLVFFSIIFFILNYLGAAVQSYDTGFFQEDMESKASQISELMVMNKGVWIEAEPVVLGLSRDWPVLNSTKIQWLSVYCSYPANYTKLMNSLGVHPRSMVKIQVNGTRADGSPYELATCNIREPVGSKVESKRFALNESGGTVVVSVKIW
jgi:hypothetical protein